MSQLLPDLSYFKKRQVVKIEGSGDTAPYQIEPATFLGAQDWLGNTSAVDPKAN